MERLRGLFVACLFLLGGCASVTSVQRADTLGAGNLEFAVEPGSQLAVNDRAAAPIPHVDAALRIGVAERVDVGVRVGAPWAEAMVKVLLTEPGHDRLALSVAPAVGVSVVLSRPPVTVMHGTVPFLAGVKFGDHELVLGTRPYFLWGNGGGLFALGGSLGVAFQVAPVFALMPEFGVVVPVTSFGGMGFMVGPGSGPVLGLFEFKLGVLLGRRRARPRP